MMVVRWLMSIGVPQQPSPRPSGPPLSRFRRGDEIMHVVLISDGDRDSPHDSEMPDESGSSSPLPEWERGGTIVPG